MHRKAPLFAVGIATFLMAGCKSFEGVSPSSGPVVNKLTSPFGQLFCEIDQGGGGQIMVGVIDAAASGAGPIGQPIAALAMGATAGIVRAECQLAADAIGGVRGSPISPPAAPVGNVAIAVPAGAPTSAAPLPTTTTP